MQASERDDTFDGTCHGDASSLFHRRNKQIFKLTRTVTRSGQAAHWYDRSQQHSCLTLIAEAMTWQHGDNTG